MSGRIFLVAGEPSGDALGADLIGALRAREPSLVFASIGGPAMRAAGAHDPGVDIAGLSVLGLVEGLKAYPRVVALADETAAAVRAFAPDVVVLIDSWGFTLRVAQRLAPLLPSTPLVKYIGPQIWATRPGRARTLAAYVDHLICIHDFEEPFYVPFGLPTTVCGAPALGRAVRGDGQRFRARHGIDPARPVLLLAPGSRASEIARVAPILGRSAARLAADRPTLLTVVVAAAAVEDGVRALAARWRFPLLLLPEGPDKPDAFAAADAAIAASGTVTTEIALQGVPVVVGYKVGWITWAIARAFLFKSRYATLLNVAAGREVAPEFLQTRFTARAAAAAAAPLLDDPARRAAQVAAQDGALDAMGRGAPPAGSIAADAVLAALRAGAAAVRRPALQPRAARGA